MAVGLAGVSSEETVQTRVNVRAQQRTNRFAAARAIIIALRAYASLVTRKVVHACTLWNTRDIILSCFLTELYENSVIGYRGVLWCGGREGDASPVETRYTRFMCERGLCGVGECRWRYGTMLAGGREVELSNMARNTRCAFACHRMARA